MQNNKRAKLLCHRCEELVHILNRDLCEHCQLEVMKEWQHRAIQLQEATA